MSSCAGSFIFLIGKERADLAATLALSLHLILTLTWSPTEDSGFTIVSEMGEDYRKDL